MIRCDRVGKRDAVLFRVADTCAAFDLGEKRTVERTKPQCLCRRSNRREFMRVLKHVASRHRSTKPAYERLEQLFDDLLRGPLREPHMATRIHSLIHGGRPVGSQFRWHVLHRIERIKCSRHEVVEDCSLGRGELSDNVRCAVFDHSQQVDPHATEYERESKNPCFVPEHDEHAADRRLHETATSVLGREVIVDRSHRGVPKRNTHPHLALNGNPGVQGASVDRNTFACETSIDSIEVHAKRNGIALDLFPTGHRASLGRESHAGDEIVEWEICTVGSPQHPPTFGDAKALTNESSQARRLPAERRKRGENARSVSYLLDSAGA